MIESAKAIPDGYHSITPYLVVKKAAQAIEFYKKAFDAQERFRMNGPDSTSIGHAELKIGDSVFMLADEFPQMKCRSPESIGGSTISIYLYVSDVDATFNRAVSEGANVIEPVTDKFYGDRSGLLKDPFGHYWSVATHKKDVSPEEMKKGAEAAFAEMAKKGKSN